VLVALGARLGERHLFRAAMAVAAIDVGLVIAAGSRLR
jgi:hypothetical protein